MIKMRAVLIAFLLLTSFLLNNPLSRASDEPVLSSPFPVNGSTGVNIQEVLSIYVSDPNGDLMNVYWYENTTDGFVLRQTNASVGNGTYYYDFTQADAYNTKYWWKVAVNDSIFNTTAIYHFTTKGMWWNSSWNYRKLITINSSMVNETLINFPVLIYNSSDSDLANYAQDDGDDIAFVAMDNTTQYNHEIELFNGTSGETIAWVNITSVSHSSDTTFWMYYDNPGVSSQENIAGTWDSNYVMVQHMYDDPNASHIADSTSYHNNGTKRGVNEPIENMGSRIDGGQNFDGVDDYINCSNDSSLDIAGMNFTVEAWVNADDILGPPQAILSKGNYELKEYDDEFIWQVIGDADSWSKSGDVGDTPTDLAVYDGKLYVNCVSSYDVYVFDGSTWSKSGDVGGSSHGLAVYDGKLYVACSSSNEVYVFNGSTWSKSGDVGTAPRGLAVYDGKLYTACGNSNAVYVFNGSTWSKSGDVGTVPWALATYDGKLYASCGSNDVYVFDGSAWSKSGNVGARPKGLAVYDSKLYTACGDSDDVYVFDGSAWSKSGDVGDIPRALAAYNGKLYVACSGSDDVYVFNGSAWSKSGDTGGDPFGLAVYDGKLYVACVGPDDVNVFGAGDAVRTDRQSGWNYVVGYLTESEIGIASDGDVKSISSHSLSISSNIYNLYIGKGYGSSQSGYFGGNDEQFNGTLDEIRISNITRNSSWINTTYNTVNSPSTFLTVGSGQSAGSPAFSNPNPANGATGISILTTTWNITIEDPQGDTFNWTIETSPDIGSNSSNDDTNGSKEVNISGNLSYNTRYTVYVNATDAQSHWRNETFWFETEVETTIPMTTTNASTGMEETNATLHGYLSSDGNATTTCGFRFGDQPGVYSQNYTVGTFASGSGFYKNTSNLVSGTAYWYQAWAKNVVGFVNGTEQYVLTKPTDPLDFTSEAVSSTVICLTWNRSVGTIYTNTYIECKNTNREWRHGEGSVIYNGTGTTFDHTHLAPNVHYYYQMWHVSKYAFNSTFIQWSDGNTSSSTTTKLPPGGLPHSVNDITVYVHDKSRTPIQNATVSIYEYEPDMVTLNIIRSGATNEDGLYETTLDDGVYNFDVLASGYKKSVRKVTVDGDEIVVFFMDARTNWFLVILLLIIAPIIVLSLFLGLFCIRFRIHRF